MHGGLSPSFESFDQFRSIKVPFEVPDMSSLVTDTLWSDPDRTVTGNCGKWENFHDKFYCCRFSK